MSESTTTVKTATTATMTMMLPVNGYYVLLSLPVLYTLYRFFFKPRFPHPLPPGPPGLPILGNLFDMPKQYDWLHYASLSKLYGPINSLSALGQTIIILNSPTVIADLLEKRQHIYSDRPQMKFSGELIGWNATLGGTDYGEFFKAQRRAMHRVMGSSALVGRFSELIGGEARRFVKRVVEDSDKWEHFVRMCVALLLRNLRYAYDCGRL